MHLDDIRKVLKHCYVRQAEKGPGSAFRFSLFMGPKRKRLFANYPNTSNPNLNESDKNRRKKKGKGKQREEDPLEGLLQIEESEELPTAEYIETLNEHGPDPTAAGPSNQNRNTSEQQIVAASNQDLVRIDMGQMTQLKEMGYEAVGPVNGPNEGYPEYEVRQAVLQVLLSNRQSQNRPTPTEGDNVVGDNETNPVPIPIDPSLLDPSLLGQANQDQGFDDSLHATGLVPDMHLEVGSAIRPTTPPNCNAESANRPNVKKTPKKQLGKRPQANVSPQTNRHPQGSRKKKKITDDDLAAMEAENMGRLGARQRTKPTRK
jgi:hypothetical protein